MIKNSNIATPPTTSQKTKCGYETDYQVVRLFPFRTLSHKPETINQSIATTKQFNLSLFCFLNMLNFDWKHLPLFSVFGYFF